MKVIIRKDGKLFFNNHHMVNVNLICGIDIAYSESIASDYTVIATGAVDPIGNIYVIDLFRERIKPDMFPIVFFRLHRKWNWDFVGIDASANQIAHYLIYPWLNRKWVEILPETRDESKITLPVIDELKHTNNKHSIIEAVCSAEWRNIRFVKNLPHFDELKHEFEELRKARHDDIPDAITNMIMVKRVPPMVDLTRINPRTLKVARKPGLIDQILEEVPPENRWYLL